MQDFQRERTRLVNDLAAGRIDRITYEKEMEQLGSDTASVPQLPSGSTSSPAPAIPSDSTGQVSAGIRSSGRGAIGPGTIISGRFVLESQLGRGGMGEVWKAWEKSGRRRLVIKILPAELQGNQTEVRRIEEMFRRVEGLQHEHICPTLLIDDDPATVGCYIVMKFITGITLREYWKQTVAKQRGFPWKDVEPTLRPIAAALDYAHAHRVVHRDVKTENIMVTADGRDPQLVDFGLAAEIRDSHARVSNVRMEGAGTYPYMAPEQWKGSVQEGAVDQYALAVVAYELLTSGGFPFFDADPARLRKLVLSQDVPAIQTLPQRANDALRRALAKKSAKRFPTCLAFIDALTSGLGSSGAAGMAVPPPLTNAAAPSSTSTFSRLTQSLLSSRTSGPSSSRASATMVSQASDPSAPPRVRRASIVGWILRQVVSPLDFVGDRLISRWANVSPRVGGIVILIVSLVIVTTLVLLLGKGVGNFDH